MDTQDIKVAASDVPVDESAADNTPKRRGRKPKQDTSNLVMTTETVEPEVKLSPEDISISEPESQDLSEDNSNDLISKETSDILTVEDATPSERVEHTFADAQAIVNATKDLDNADNTVGKIYMLTHPVNFYRAPANGCIEGTVQGTIIIDAMIPNSKFIKIKTFKAGSGLVYGYILKSYLL